MTCPVCTAETTDGIICTRCTRILHADLTDLPEWIGYLQDTLTKQTASGKSEGRSSEQGLPFNVEASTEWDDVVNTLTTWVRDLIRDDEQITDAQPSALATWMLQRFDRIVAHHAVDEIADEIHYRITQIRKVVDIAPERVYVGPCRGNVDGVPCSVQLMASAGKDEHTCPECGTRVDVQVRRDELLGLVGQYSATAAGCVHALSALSVPVTTKQIHKWVDRGKLQRVGRNGIGVAEYRISDVRELAAAALANRRTRLTA